MSKKKKQNKTYTADAFSNPAARLGFGTLDLMQSTEYPLTRITDNYQLLTSMYRDNWIVQSIVELVPNDIMSRWIDIKTAADGQYMDKLNRVMRRTRVKDKLQDGMIWGRLYGGAAGLIMIKGHDDLSQPLDINTVMPDSFIGIHIVDRWSGIFPEGEIVTDASDPDFGLPMFYDIKDANDTFLFRVHHSRVVRFIGRPLPWQESVTELYWGESEIEPVYNEVVKRDNVAANIAALTFKANMEYREVEGLDQLLGVGNTEMQRRFWNMMQAQAIMRNSQGLSLVNKGDAVHTEQYTFAGLADVYDRIMMDVSGACHIPVTKLFGRSPSGMNATGESDMRNYYDYVDSVRNSILRPVLDKLLPIICVSTWGKMPDDLDYEFVPMEDPDEVEEAKIARDTIESIIAVFQSNLIDKETALKELADTKVFDKITDEIAEEGRGISFNDITSMNDPFTSMGYAPNMSEGEVSE